MASSPARSTRRFARAIAANAADGNIVLLDLETLGNLQAAPFAVCREIHVKNPAALIAIKMAMLPHVRAIARRRAFQVYMPHEAALHQRIQAIINRRVRDLRHLPFRPHKNFVRRGMIALVQQHVIDLLPLRGETKTARRQATIEIFTGLFLHSVHGKGQVKAKNPVGQDLE